MQHQQQHTRARHSMRAVMQKMRSGLSTIAYSAVPMSVAAISTPSALHAEVGSITQAQRHNVAAPVPARISNRVDVVTEMTEKLAKDPMKVHEDAERQLARMNINHQDAALLLWADAQAHFRMGDVERARAQNARATRAAATTSNNQIYAYTRLLEALLDRTQNDYGTALTLVQEAQQRFIAIGDARGHGVTLQTMATIYSDVREWETALNLLRQAKSIYNGDALYRMVTANNHSVALEGIGNVEEAIEMVKAAAEAAGEAKMDNIRVRTQLNLMSLYALNDRVGLAEQGMAQLLREYPWLASDNQANQVRMRIAVAREQWQSAEHYFEITDSQDESSLGIARLMLGYRIARQLGNTPAALQRIDRATELSDKEARTIARNRTAVLAARFQFSAQEARVAQARTETLENEINYQRQIFWILLIAGVGLGTTLLAYLRSEKKARNQAEADGQRLTLANVELARALQAKTEFLAATSHELRTPLNGILGMTQVMDADQSMDERHRRQIQLILNAGDRMRQLIDDILDVAKEEQGGLSIDLAPTDPVAIGRQVVELFKGQAEKNGLTLNYEIEPELDNETAPLALLLDPHRVSQIYFNLIGNAVKFTQDGGIKVRIAKAEKMLQIEVEDSGIGIADDMRDVVFERFRQVDASRTRNYGGSGLGLAITKSLVEAMGGTIKLDSTLGEGSTFTVELPWNEASADETQPETTETPAQTSPVHQQIETIAQRMQIEQASALDAATGNAPQNATPEGRIAVSYSRDGLRASMMQSALRKAGAQVTRANSIDEIIERHGDETAVAMIDAADWPTIQHQAADRAQLWDVIVIEDKDATINEKIVQLPNARVRSLNRTALTKSAVTELWQQLNAVNEEGEKDPPLAQRRRNA